MNPVAINSVPAALSALAAVVHEAARDLMAIEPKLFRFLASKRPAAIARADRNRQIRFRCDYFRVALENQIQYGTGIMLVFVVAKIEQCRTDPRMKHFLDRRETLLKRSEEKTTENPSLRSWKNTNGRFGDNTETPFAADQQSIQIDPRRSFRYRPRSQDFTVWQHRFQTHDLLAHRTVNSSAITHAVSRDRAADSGHGNRPRIMPENKTDTVQLCVQ